MWLHDRLRMGDSRQGRSSYSAGSSDAVMEINSSEVDVPWNDLDGNTKTYRWKSGMAFSGLSTENAIHKDIGDNDTRSPNVCFRLFWTDTITDFVVHESNHYASTSGKSSLSSWKHLSNEEFHVWLELYYDERPIREYKSCPPFLSK